MQDELEKLQRAFAQQNEALDDFEETLRKLGDVPVPDAFFAAFDAATEIEVRPLAVSVVPFGMRV